MKLFLTYSYLILLALGLYLPKAEGIPSLIRPRHIIQFSGIVVEGDSLTPVPFTNIWVKNTHRGTVSDFYGFFSIVVQAHDTLRFSNIGYKDVYYVVPDTMRQNRYSVVQILTRDTIILPETVIFPWPTREQFRHAFLNTKIPDDDYDRAMRNLAIAEMRERLERMPMDGGANFRHAMNQHAQRMYYIGQTPPMRIFDPFAWAQFIRAWREGRFRRSD
ncbi:MAG TPA: hypothetical protein DCM62_03950 [Bacteroidales bacterium]|nr:hypothetical protein [Bacteroidales bacterium]